MSQIQVFIREANRVATERGRSGRRDGGAACKGARGEPYQRHDGVFRHDVNPLGPQPNNRAGWAQENVLPVVVGIALFLGRRRYPLTLPAWTMIFLFGLLHTLSAHYT